MGIIQKALRCIAYPHKHSSKAYVSFLRRKGVNVSDGVTFYNPSSTLVDLQYPFLISIEENANISANVSIFTHDYSWSVIKAKCGYIYGACGEVHIGKNVFVGEGVTILRGSHIGDNSIVASKSLVVTDIPSNEVWGGVPAKFISTLDSFSSKRKSRQEDEAYLLYKDYVAHYKCEPSESLFYEYISLFVDFSNPQNINKYQSRISLMNNFNFSCDILCKEKPRFKSFDEMINHFRAR